jgi:hypothetical protein
MEKSKKKKKKFDIKKVDGIEKERNRTWTGKEKKRLRMGKGKRKKRAYNNSRVCVQDGIR